MKGQLTMFDLMNSKASSNATFLQASVVGPTHCDSPDGRKINPSGQPHARVSRSVKPVKDWEQKTRATYGRCFDVWLAGASLQQSLESKLRQRLAEYGSPEFELTWRDWDMQSGPQICALRASGRRKSGKDSTGVPAAWPTPQTHDMSEAGKGTRERGGRRACLATASKLSGWATPTVRDHKDTGQLDETAIRGGQMRRDTIATQAFGMTQSGTTAPTEKPVALVLNPKFSLWLMGFPVEWASCGERAMLSCRNSRLSSSKRSKKSQGKP